MDWGFDPDKMFEYIIIFNTSVIMAASLARIVMR